MLQDQTGSEQLPIKIVSMSLDWLWRILLVLQGQTWSELQPEDSENGFRLVAKKFY